MTAPAARPVAITCGEPAGIGPEIVMGARAALGAEIPLFWIGDPAHLPPGSDWQAIDAPAAAADVDAQVLPVLAHPFPKAVTPGAPEPDNAAAVMEVIARGVALVMEGAACALCTAPIHKKVLKDGAAFPYPGHTEFLEALTGAPRAVMMLASPHMRVVPATIHIALQEVPDTLTPALLRDTIRITAADLKARFGLPHPRIAVAGLNPHAGEGGTMGRQEADWIARLVAEMAAEGLDVTGPWPGDTLFHAAARARYDVAVAMYHDQALIPIKTLDFDRGVNVTLGLPIVRTSPDHGTAFDIAGTGQANPASMIEALRLAWTMGRSA
ncbi:MAG: 4-hydroxythreonine-4-phosphate dehydrogenase PdxA [Pseudomonadota bacterium]